MARLIVGAVFGAMTLFGGVAHAADEDDVGGMQETPLAAAESVTPPTPVAAYGIWDRLAACESTSRWHIATGNGYYGGLQFDRRTWLDYGGGDYASRADFASREEQIDIAQRVRAVRGYQPWPACSRRLGLR